MVAERAWGAPYLFQELVKREPTCVWLELTKEDEGDLIAVGNSLADALTRAFGVTLFGHGMPYSYGLGVLEAHLALFEPLTFILSGATFDQPFADALLRLQRPGNTLVLEFERLPDQFLIPDTARVLQADDLRLTQAEAEALVQARVEEVETRNLYRVTDGAFERFLLALHKRLALPPRLRPHPTGGALPPGAEAGIAPEILLSVLERRGQWREALEVAAEHAPERVAGLLEHAGEVYLERGLYGRLWEVLAGLPENLSKTRSENPSETPENARILTWRLRAARRLGHVDELREAVEAHLDAHEAPDLRALYASTLPGARGLTEAARAYHAAKTPLTLQHYGNALAFRDPARSLEVFRELVALTKHRGSSFEKATAEMVLALPLLLLGRYHEAAYGLDRALTTFDEEGRGDWQARLHMLHNLAYARLLIGETVGLHDLLQREVGALQDVYPALAVGFRSTLADYLLSQGSAQEALPYYLENLNLAEASTTRGHDFPLYLVRDAVHALLHAGEPLRAATLARKHLYAGEAEGEPRTFATLAQGMVSALLRPEDAVAPLEKTCDALEASMQSVHLVSACLYLAKALLSLGETERARAALTRCQAGLKELSDTGFRLLAGPEEAFREVKALWRGDDAPLTLLFLGSHEAVLGGETLELYPQWREVLVLLALHPEGLSLEQLLLLLYGEEGNPANLKATLSKVRKLVPITRPPYHLAVPYKADFVDCAAHLREGALRAALELYQGPLLLTSEAPGVVEARETLEESLRQAVLASGDAEALLSLSERFEEDLELWEASLEALPRQDPRRPLAVAKQRRVLENW